MKHYLVTECWFAVKLENLTPHQDNPRLRLVEKDIRYPNLPGWPADSDTIVHLAARWFERREKP